MITTHPDGRYSIDKPVVFTCGCGGVVPEVKLMLRKAGVDVPHIAVPSNNKAKKYLRQEGLRDAIPSVKSGKYGILFNPKTRQFIDLLKAPKNEMIFNNIRRVVDGAF